MRARGTVRKEEPRRAGVLAPRRMGAGKQGGMSEGPDGFRNGGPLEAWLRPRSCSNATPKAPGRLWILTQVSWASLGSVGGGDTHRGRGSHLALCRGPSTGLRDCGLRGLRGVKGVGDAAFLSSVLFPSPRSARDDAVAAPASMPGAHRREGQAGATFILAHSSAPQGVGARPGLQTPSLPQWVLGWGWGSLRQSLISQENKALAEGTSEEGGLQHWASVYGLLEALA